MMEDADRARAEFDDRALKIMEEAVAQLAALRDEVLEASCDCGHPHQSMPVSWAMVYETIDTARGDSVPLMSTIHAEGSQLHAAGLLSGAARLVEADAVGLRG